ncbi:MAG TPA: hypothetical protein DCS97_05935 [Planctomycetes bacterium]|nr:hypothetical protein [Planctomycetota bacterium]
MAPQHQMIGRHRDHRAAVRQADGHMEADRVVVAGRWPEAGHAGTFGEAVGQHLYMQQPILGTGVPVMRIEDPAVVLLGYALDLTGHGDGDSGA